MATGLSSRYTLDTEYLFVTQFGTLELWSVEPDGFWNIEMSADFSQSGARLVILHLLRDPFDDKSLELIDSWRISK